MLTGGATSASARPWPELCAFFAVAALPSGRIRSALLTLAFALVLAAPAQAALQVGIGDQHPSAYADARLRALRLPVARMIVPWDKQYESDEASPPESRTWCGRSPL